MKSLKKSLKESHDIIFLKIYCTRFEKFGLFKSIWSIWHPYFPNILLFVKALHITLLTMTGGQSGVNILVKWYPKLKFGRNRLPHVLHAFQNRTKTDLLKNTVRMRRSAEFQDFCTVTPLRLALSGRTVQVSSTERCPGNDCANKNNLYLYRREFLILLLDPRWASGGSLEDMWWLIGRQQVVAWRRCSGS